MHVLSVSRLHRLTGLSSESTDRFALDHGWALEVNKAVETEEALVQAIRGSPPLSGLVLGEQAMGRGALAALADSGSKIGTVPCIARDGAGIDNIDLRAAAELGIPVSYCPGLNSRAVAEFAVGLILTSTRRIHEQHFAMRLGGWHSSIGSLLWRKRFGLLGFGRVGQKIAGILLGGFRASVLVCDRELENWSPLKSNAFRRLRQRRQGSIEAVEDVKELFSRSDIVVIAASLNASSKNIVNADILNDSRPGVTIINISRGELVNTTAMIQALNSGQVGYYATDVYSEEPLPDCSKLRVMKNVLLTCHSASLTHESRPLQTRRAFKNLHAMMTGQKASVRSYVV